VDKPIHIVLADDHQMFLDGIVTMLQRNRKIKVDGTARSGKELIAIVENELPEIVITDLQMNDMTGLEATKIIRNKYPGIKVIALTMHNEPGFIRKLIEHDISGYILKNAGYKILTHAIEKVAAGGTFFSDEVLETMMQSLKQPANEKQSKFSLTPREREIIALICKECTTNEIADILKLSPLTIETHRKNIFLKLKVKNIAGLVKIAIHNNLDKMP